MEDIRGLKQGRISQKALFSLWDGYEEGGKNLLLKLLCEFDLLMLLEGDEESIGRGCSTVGVPALMPYGWDDFNSGRAAGEIDLEVATQFAEAIPQWTDRGPNRTLASNAGIEESNADSTHAVSISLIVRADAALLRVSDGSRVFVAFKGAERQLCWQFQGLHPISVAQRCIRQVEYLLNNPLRFIAVDRTHVVVLDCDSGRGGCGASRIVQVKLSKSWTCEESCNALPADETFYEKSMRPWSPTETSALLCPEASH